VRRERVDAWYWGGAGILDTLVEVFKQVINIAFHISRKVAIVWVGAVYLYFDV
jgi:hypothetical protein